MKGHGLQRATIFALLRSWADVLCPADGQEVLSPRKASESIVFAIEEPELFLHPHAQRQLALALENIAAAPGYQVFACSHSTHFVNLDQYKSLTIVSKNDPEEGTIVRQCCVDLFEGEGAKDRKDRFHLASWVNPDRGEMFFAKKVVFVEGETEKTILPFLADKLGLSDPSVSIIDCGAKHNLPLYIAVANAFKLEYVVVHDEDPLPDPIPPEWSKDTERAKKRTFALNAEIDTTVDCKLGSVLVLRPDFEEAAGVSRSQGHKKGKALAALGHFAEQTEDQIPEQLKNLVQSIYGQQKRLNSKKSWQNE